MCESSGSRPRHAPFARGRDVLGRDVRLGAVRGDPDGGDPEVVRPSQVFHGADAGEQERGEPGAGDRRAGRLDPLPVGVRTRAVCEAAAAKTVAVRDLDRVDTGGVERRRDAPYVVEPVRCRMACMPRETSRPDVDPHRATAVRLVTSLRDPQRRDLMMSRFPAYAGR